VRKTETRAALLLSPTLNPGGAPTSSGLRTTGSLRGLWMNACARQVVSPERDPQIQIITHWAIKQSRLCDPDKEDPNVLHIEITGFDRALTRPWTLLNKTDRCWHIPDEPISVGEVRSSQST
jgi:hypothetical protein